jgi:hypothetical protein
MNPRIRELAEQAGINKDAFQFSGTPIKHIVDEPSLEKFAELIVRECMRMCKTAVGNADYNTGRLHCLNNIKEHFGVEE